MIQILDFLVSLFRGSAWWLVLPAWYFFKNDSGFYKKAGLVVFTLCLLAITCDVIGDLSPKADTEQAQDYDPRGTE